MSEAKKWSTLIFKWLFLRFFMRLKVWKALCEHNKFIEMERNCEFQKVGDKEGKWDKVRRKCALVWTGVQTQDGYQMGFVSGRGEQKEGSS